MRLIAKAKNGIKIGNHILIYKEFSADENFGEFEEKLKECTKEELIQMHILRDWNPRWKTKSALNRIRRERTERKIAEMLKEVE